MELSKAQQVLIERARSAGNSALGVHLSEEALSFLAATIVRDLDRLREFPEIQGTIPDFFSPNPRKLVLPGVAFAPLIEKVFSLIQDADTYFACLATLHKSRLKYLNVIEYQPIPTMEQIGPRALLQYGQMSAKALAGFILWRKWLFDIDNRAGQETGYLFEPIIANAIGGIPLSARKSPIKRHEDPSKGRQVDCLKGNKAYEIKIRVTIAASGQGRWKEELNFPKDCRESGYTPVLIVLDSTPNPKLSELKQAFLQEGGDVYVGEEAWQHLKEEAGSTMSRFIEKYVRAPINEVMQSTPSHLPEITLKMSDDVFCIELDGEKITYKREE